MDADGDVKVSMQSQQLLEEEIMTEGPSPPGHPLAHRGAGLAAVDICGGVLETPRQVQGPS
jgi:hypothetical protein